MKDRCSRCGRPFSHGQTVDTVGRQWGRMEFEHGNVDDCIRALSELVGELVARERERGGVISAPNTTGATSSEQ